MKKWVKGLIAVGVILGFVGVCFVIQIFAEAATYRSEITMQEVIADGEDYKDIFKVSKPAGWIESSSNDMVEVMLEEPISYGSIAILCEAKEGLGYSFEEAEKMYHQRFTESLKGENIQKKEVELDGNGGVEYAFDVFYEGEKTKNIHSIIETEHYIIQLVFYTPAVHYETNKKSFDFVKENFTILDRTKPFEN